MERPDDLLSKPPPILTPRRNRIDMIGKSQLSIHRKDTCAHHDVFDQKKRVGFFCLEMMTPIKVLKLNRDKKWQTRWLTFSQEGTFLQHSLLTEEQKIFCPEALLWVKKKKTIQKKNGLRGGIKLVEINGIRIELIDVKKSYSGKKGTHSILHIDWKSKNNTTTFLIEREAGKKIQMGLLDLISFLMGAVQRKDEENSNMYVSSPQSMKQDNQNSSPTDVTELLHCVEEKEMDFSPLLSGLESHSYHQPCIHRAPAREINDLKPKKLIREFDESGDFTNENNLHRCLTITSGDAVGNLTTSLEASQADAYAKCEISSTSKERLRNVESVQLISSMDACYVESKLESQLSIAKLQIESRDVKIKNLEKKLYEAVLIEMKLKYIESLLSRNIKVIQSLENDVAMTVEYEKELRCMTTEFNEKTDALKEKENIDRCIAEYRSYFDACSDTLSRILQIENAILKALAGLDNKDMDDWDAFAFIPASKVNLIQSGHEVTRVKNIIVNMESSSHFLAKDPVLDEDMNTCYQKNIAPKELRLDSEEKPKEYDTEMKETITLGETQSYAEILSDAVVDSKDDACMNENVDTSTIPHRQRERQLEDEISRLEILLNNANEHINSLSGKVMTLELETKGTEKQYLNPTDLNLQLKELKEENIELYKDIERYEIREAEVKDAIDRLKTATDTVKSNLEEKKKIILQLKDSSNTLEAELAETEAKALQLEEKNVQLAKENSNLQFNISTMTKDKSITIQMYEDKINRIEEGRKEISNDLNSSINIGIELDHAMERKRAEIANLVLQIEKEKEALVAANTKISELTSANESLTSRNEIQKVVVRRLETEDGALRNEITTLQGEIENLLKEKESVEEKLRILSTEIQTDIMQKKSEDATKTQEEGIARKSMILDGKYSDTLELLRSELEDQKELELKKVADLASYEKEQLSIFYTNKIDTLKSDMEMLEIENTEDFIRIRSQASVIRKCKSILLFLLLVLTCREYILQTEFTRIECFNVNSTYSRSSSTLLDRVGPSDYDSDNLKAIDMEGLVNGANDTASFEENQKVNMYNADPERADYDDSLVGQHKAITTNSKSTMMMNTLKRIARTIFGTDKVHYILRDALLYPIPKLN